MTIKCKVKSITPLACNTYRILLQPETTFAFQAGQYLMVVMGEKDKRAFSIANGPERDDGLLELHIGAAEHNAYAIEVVDSMKEALNTDGDIIIDAPHGEAGYRAEAQSNILLIAGGTGFSYVRSILEHCLSQHVTIPIYLYWGAKDCCQLYELEEMNRLHVSYSNVTFIPVVENAEAGWPGKVGNVLDAVSDDFSLLTDFDIYIAGRFEMAAAARERFTQEKSAKRERMFADAYSFI